MLADQILEHLHLTPADAGQFTRRHRVVWVICLLAIVVGGVFRFVNLDRKIMACDEARTALHVGGYTQKTAPQIYDRQRSAGTLTSYGVLPGSTVFDTFEACRVDTPYNPPLYFVLAGVWARLFGTDASALRSFPALLSLLEIPCCYFLCLQLFESAAVAAVVVTLDMVSPFNLHMAQFARPYSLWTVLTLLSSLLLLRACREGTRRTWIAYTAASALSLYTHLSALRVLAGDVIFGCLVKVQDRQFKLAPLLSCSGIALLLYIPWLIDLNNYLYSRWPGVKWFTEASSENHDLLQSWCSHLCQVFVDAEQLFPSAQAIALPLVLCLVAAAVLFFIRTANTTSFIFLLSLFATTFLSMALPDLTLSSNRSAEIRYMMPVALAIQCMVGFAVASWIVSKHRLVSGVGMTIFVALTASGLVSCWSVLQDRTYYGWGSIEIAAGKVLNQCQTPTLFGWRNSAGTPQELVALATQLRPDIALQFSSHDQFIPLILPGKTKDVFIWHPSRGQLKRLSEVGQNYVQEKEALWLWKLDETNWCQASP